MTQAPTPGPLSGDDGYDGHYSDCAIHNAPALPVGPCDCGSPFLSPDDIKRAKELRYDPDSEDNERFASWYGDTLLDVHALALRQSSMLHRLAPTAPVEASGSERGESAGDMLSRLGMDGKLWAEEFQKTALALGYPEMDDGWLLGWFCNAIMAGYDHARRKYDPEVIAALGGQQEERPDFVDAVDQFISDAEENGSIEVMDGSVAWNRPGLVRTLRESLRECGYEIVESSK